MTQQIEEKQSSQNSVWDNFVNLYAVRKTINFEFKPSISTKNRIEKIIQEESKLINAERNTIEIRNFFNNQIQENVKLTKRYFNENLENFDEILNKFKEITGKIKTKNNYENFRIYVNTDKIKLLGKDFRDCYLAMKKKKSWKYKGVNNTLKLIKFNDFLTICHLFDYNKDTKTNENEFEKLFSEKTELLIKKYEFIKKQLKDFLDVNNDVNNQAEKFITKPEILDRLKSMAFCLQEMIAVMNIFCDEGKNGSDGFLAFVEDLKGFRKLVLDKNCEEIIDEIIRQANHITNPKAFHYKFTLNFKAKNPNTQLSGNDTFLSEKKLQEKLKQEMDKLEANKKKKSDCQSYISKFDNFGEKKCTKDQWDLVLNKQGLPDDFAEAKKQYDEAKKIKKKSEKEISDNQNEKNNYAVINQLKAALRNSRNTHFGVLLKKDGNYYLALENKILDGKLKADNEYVLKKLENKKASCQLLSYESLTWKAVEKLCLLPTSSLNGKDEDMVEYWGKFCKSEIILEKKNDNDKRLLLDTEKIKTYLKKIVSDNSLSKFFDEKTFDECKSLDEIKKYFNDACFTNKWVNADWEEFLKLDNEGKVDLYQIFNKDFELDEKFATSENDQQIIERIKKAKENLEKKFVPKHNNTERGKSLFTIYWQNCVNDLNVDKYRLQPEGKIYIRDKSPIQKSKRYQEKKVLGDFGVLFNPITKEIDQSSRDGKTRIGNFNNYLNKYSRDEICVIGLDRGENNLVSYGLVKFKKKIMEDSDIKVRFDNEIANECWALDEIVEVRDLSAVKVFNKNGNWEKSEFVKQKEDFYFTEKNGTNYDEEKNKQSAENKKTELKNQYPNYKDGKERIVIIPIRYKPKKDEEFQKTGAYAVKILSWEEQDGSVYNYRVAQEVLKENRLEQIEKNKDTELFETEKFKNGYVSALVGFIAEKVKKYNAFVSLENLNINKAKQGNYEKTFGASVYQVIENGLIIKLGYLILKNNPQNYTQLVPEIRRIEELKKGNDEKDRNYQLGFVQITDETNTSKICPNCGYSKNRYVSAKISKGILELTLKNNGLENIDFGIDANKNTQFQINEKTKAYKYTDDGVMTEELMENNNKFIKAICDSRQNETKSKDFIRCVHCGFDSRYPENNHSKLKAISSGDNLATYNITKRGLELLIKNLKNKDKLVENN